MSSVCCFTEPNTDDKNGEGTNGTLLIVRHTKKRRTATTTQSPPPTPLRPLRNNPHDVGKCGNAALDQNLMSVTWSLFLSQNLKIVLHLTRYHEGNILPRNRFFPKHDIEK